MEQRRSHQLQDKRTYGTSKAGPEFSEGIDALPDEILALIFSFVMNGRTLLDVLPLVCKRWFDVARDPASWAQVTLWVGHPVADQARILLHAPAARSLEIDAAWTPRFARTRNEKDTIRMRYEPGGFYAPEIRRRLRSALSRSRAVVRHSITILEQGWSIVGQPWDRDESGTSPAIACFLARQRDLRELQLYLHPGEEAAMLPAIAELRRLRKLELVSGPGVQYNGQLAGGLPKLRELRVHAKCPRDECQPEPPRGLVGDLVRAATALRVLEVDMPVGTDLEACREVRGLQHVALNVFRDGDGRLRPVKEAAISAVRGAFALLLQMESTALRSAEVSLCRGEHARYPRSFSFLCHVVCGEYSLQMPRSKIMMLVDCEGARGVCDECGYGDLCPGRNWPV